MRVKENFQERMAVFHVKIQLGENAHLDLIANERL
jgi:hypothetical protein